MAYIKYPQDLVFWNLIMSRTGAIDLVKTHAAFLTANQALTYYAKRSLTLLRLFQPVSQILSFW